MRFVFMKLSNKVVKLISGADQICLFILNGSLRFVFTGLLWRGHNL